MVIPSTFDAFRRAGNPSSAHSSETPVHPQSPALRALADKWDAVPAAERANFQSYVTEFCDALGVAPPRPRGSGYEFEYPVTTTDRRTGKDSTNFIDLYRQGHFILEAKDSDAGSARTACWARRTGRPRATRATWRTGRRRT